MAFAGYGVDETTRAGVREAMLRCAYFGLLDAAHLLHYMDGLLTGRYCATVELWETIERSSPTSSNDSNVCFDQRMEMVSSSTYPFHSISFRKIKG